MNGYWLLLYDGNGRRLGRPWWSATLPEAEHEAALAFGDSEKVREAVVYQKREGVPPGWAWEKVQEMRRGALDERFELLVHREEREK